MRPAAVLFDVGGTLVDARDYDQWAETARGVGLEVEGESIASAREELRPWKSSPQLGRAEEWQLVLSRAAGTLVNRETAVRFVGALDAVPLPGFLYSDVRKALEKLRTGGLRLGVVSNSRSERAVCELLSRLGVAGFFTAVISSGTEGVSKPHPEIFRRALDRMGVPAFQTVHVGDDLEKDAQGARNAGLHPVWLNRLGTGDGPGEFTEILSLSELPRVVRSIDAGAPVK
jgi:HAD superfamily hydrolase (TIGR01662 family)